MPFVAPTKQSVRWHTADTRSKGNEAVTKGLNTAARKIQQAFFKQMFYRLKCESKSLYYWQYFNTHLGFGPRISSVLKITVCLQEMKRLTKGGNVLFFLKS
jgi:hypothetical protein